jgi:hypothetical protein
LRFLDESLNDFALLSDNLIEGCSMKILSLILFSISIFVVSPGFADQRDPSLCLGYRDGSGGGGDQFAQCINMQLPEFSTPATQQEEDPTAWRNGKDLADSNYRDERVQLDDAMIKNAVTGGWRKVHVEFEGGTSRAASVLGSYSPKASLYREVSYDECATKLDKAFEMCDPKKNEQVMGVVNMAKMAASSFAGMSSQGACGSLGKTAQLMNGASAAFSSTCAAQYHLAEGDCGKDVELIGNDIKDLETDYYQALRTADAVQVTPAVTAARADAEALSEKLRSTREARDKVRQQANRAGAFDKNIGDAAQSIMMFAGVQMQMSQCQKLTGLDCTKSPSDPICALLNGGGAVVDCSTTAGQSNPVCICQINPSAPQCASDTSGFNAGIGSGSGGADAGNLDLSKFGGPGGFGDGGTGIFPAGAGPGEGGLGGSLQKGGSGRGNAQESGGGSNGRGGAAAGGPGGSGINTKIIGGYGVGGSGGGGSGGGSGYSRGNTGGYGAGAGNPNLKQYLPGGKMDPSRSIAGETGPDGITGPNTDIWKKVKTRYFAKKPSLLP